MKILFERKSAQVQVQLQPPHDRLTTWFQSLSGLGYEHCITDDETPLASQLEGADVYVSLTRQSANPSLPGNPSFSYTPGELYALQTWARGGGSILMFTNHGAFAENPDNDEPSWPIFAIQLAASLDIQLVFASFAPRGNSPHITNPCGGQNQTLGMRPALGAPAAVKDGVHHVQALDSGGIVTGRGTALVHLPGEVDCADESGLGYHPEHHSFAALYTFGTGKVIVMGHSGIVGNTGTCSPSAGQIDAADNLRFLNNCITYLGS
ncbi:MAG TPA: hypothetical protein VEX86_04990 [Longimicrobium sp.]|nr:hypothetical protein [Longimicrobium sp.]